ncbi:MAG: UDP-N-acetylmuramate dehydrogenase [Acidimicrobiales bacterium]
MTDPAALAAVADALGAGARRGVPLGPMTTYRVGGAAALLAEASTEEELLHVRRALRRGGGRVPVLVIGKGSNLLVADRGFAGLVLRLGRGLGAVDLPSRGAVPDRPVAVRAGGGADLPVVARRSVGAGLRGLEWAVGIPGTVGGAVRMNAGGHGSDMASCLVRFRWLDVAGDGGGQDGPGRLDYRYRGSSLSAGEVVVWAELAARPGEPAAAREQLREIVRWRRENQPGGSNAGSVFVNPPGDSAGRLVEEAGLKGLRLGTARVSEKHANFIQADDGGTAADVVALMDRVREAVAARCGVELRPEVRLVGFG